MIVERPIDPAYCRDIRITYRYIVYYCLVGLNPDVWTNKVEFDRNELLDLESAKHEANNIVDGIDGPWANIHILSVKVLKVTEEPVELAVEEERHGAHSVFDDVSRRST